MDDVILEFSKAGPMLNAFKLVTKYAIAVSAIIGLSACATTNTNNTANVSNEEYREARPGQFEAPRAEMIARIQTILEADQ